MSIQNMRLQKKHTFPIKLSWHYLVLLTLVFLLINNNAILAQKKKGKNKKESKADVLSDSDRAKMEAALFSGITAKMKGDVEEAILAYEACLSVDPKNDAALYELAKIYFDNNGDREKALLYVQQAATIDSKNKWYQSLYAECLAQGKQFNEAATVYENLLKNNPNEYEYYFDWAYMLIQSGQYQKAVDAYNALEERIGVSEDISLQKQKLYIQLNDFDQAAAELQSLIETFPDEARYYLALGELYATQNKMDEAVAVYEQLLEVQPENPYVRLAMADYYRLQDDNEQYIENLKIAMASSLLPLDIKARTLGFYIEDDRPDAEQRNDLFIMVESIVDAHPDEALAYVLYGDVLYAYEQPEKALKQFKKATELDSDGFEVWYQVMIITFELERYQDLAEVSNNIMSLFPNEPLPYYFNGIANEEMENLEKAVKSLKRGAMISVKDTSLAAQMYALIGSIYNRKKEHEQSDKYYDKSLKLMPDDPIVLNNYSYYLSLRKDNLEKAADMAKRANELRPAMASFQDTYAWILFKQEKYTEALEWIEKAIANGGGASPTINEHYGDILFKLKRVDEAVEQWQLAKDLGSDSENLDRKISNKQLY